MAASLRFELLPSALWLICFPTSLEVELAGHASRHASQYARIGWKREWNLRQVIDPHACGDDDPCHLGDLHRPLADNMAAQYLVSFAVNDQLAKTDAVPIDDSTGSRVEAYDGCLDIVCLTRLRFGETDLGILGVCETADGTRRVPNYRRRASHSIGGCNEAVPYCLRNQHQATGNVASGKDMGPGSP